MFQQKAFTSLSYKEVEKKVDAWLEENPRITIQHMTQSEQGVEALGNYSFTVTVSYTVEEEAADSASHSESAAAVHA